ncbi:MAG: Xaa-Pro peptidase family protein [Acidimicrobiia bacterium]|nr:Xaa-Pro peptidase family protein [Acidimicrobiia bacterium]
MTGFDYAARMDRARRELAEREVDVLLVSIGSDLPYLTGYTAMPLERLTMAVIPRDGETVLVVPELEAPRVEAMPDVFRIQPWGETEDPIAIVAALVGPAQVAMIGDHTWSSFLLALQAALSDTVFASARPLTESLRLIKEPAEVDLLRRAGASADTVAGLLAAETFAGRTELEMSRTVGALLESNGTDVAGFAIVASGPNGASPHHEPGDRVIGEGDAIVIDFGGKVGGYCSDTTRMFHVGEPSPRYHEVHEVVLAAQRAGIAAVRPGATAASIDAAARAVIQAAGYGRYFIHRTGHGIGLDGHEDPYIVAGNERPLEPGMAFSIEPGIYLPGEFGVRIEDIVVCTDEGSERMNRSPRHVVIVH